LCIKFSGKACRLVTIHTLQTDDDGRHIVPKIDLNGRSKTEASLQFADDVDEDTGF